MTAILRRELITLLRTRSAVAAQLGLALAFALLIALRWPTEAQVGLSGAEARQVLDVFGYGLLTSILLLVPAFPATSLVRERVRGTLALLLNTPLKPWSIYLGKLLGILILVAILLLLTTPAAAACYALGGASLTREIGPLYLVLFLAALQMSALALLVSSYASSSDSALRITYGLVVVSAVAVLGPYALLQGGEGWVTALAAWVRCLSPIPAVMEVLGHGDVGLQGLTTGFSAAGRYVVLAGLVSLGLMLATMARLRSPRLLDRARATGVMTEERPAKQRVWRRLLFLVDPQRRSGYIGRWTNPVMVKEFRCRRFGRSHWMLRLIALCAVASLALSCVAVLGVLDWGVEAVGSIMVFLQMAILVLLTPSLASGLISSEHETGGWQLLQMTPLSAGAILRGKLLSVAWPLFLVLCATLPGYVVMIAVQPELTRQVLNVLACLGMTAVFAVLLGAAVSSLFRHSATATTVAYLALLAVCAGPLLFWLGRDAPFGHRTVEAALTVNPLAAALNASRTPGFTRYDLLPANWWFLGCACLALTGFLLVRTWQLTRPE
jgi:ABC-type transport system involved in multi-copper enzyme maturation permease subunit